MAMGFAESVAYGSIEGKLNRANKIAEEQLAIERERLNMTKQSLKEELYQELIEEGVLLPVYSQEEWNKAGEEIENIVSDWFKRHPDVTRWTDEFQTKYPNVKRALNTVVFLAKSRRVSPREYVELHRGLFDF